jgi:hypothetical protein
LKLCINVGKNVQGEARYVKKYEVFDWGFFLKVTPCLDIDTIIGIGIAVAIGPNIERFVGIVIKEEIP